MPRHPSHPRGHVLPRSPGCPARPERRESIVRNIRVADRSDWVTSQPPAPAAGVPANRRRWRDVIATLPILLLVPALVMIAVPASASPSGRTLLSQWSDDYRTSTVQETSAKL